MTGNLSRSVEEAPRDLPCRNQELSLDNLAFFSSGVKAVDISIFPLSDAYKLYSKVYLFEVGL